MKQSFHLIALLLLLIFLIFSSNVSVNFLATKQGKMEVKVKEDGEEGSLQEIEEVLMGMKVCENGDDEECLKRRIISEAHLDYIYTQHHKP